MSKNKEHRDKIKAWKKRQEEEFLETIPFPEPVFQELFDYLDARLQNESCRHNFDLTTSFLSTKGIKFQEQIDFFFEHGGGCDCEVLMNVEGVFPEKEHETIIRIEKPPKRERANTLKLQDLEIEFVPPPWKLFKSGNNYEFQLGKNKNIKIELIKNFEVYKWTDDIFWQRQWESMTELKVKSGRELIYDNLEGFERATFKTQDWIPVLTWIRKPGNDAWTLIFRTELSRFRGDTTELKNLLKNIK